MDHAVLASALRWAATLILTASLAACETTGDPRQGGLLGWSEQKAFQRQAALEAENKAAQDRLTQETQRGAELRSRQTRLGSEVDSLQASLASALAENDALDARLQQLMGQQQLADAELARLRQTLDASRSARTAARRAASDKRVGSSAESLARHSQAVNLYNQQLHSAVMLLMER
jgi:regulator of replication initiation timing